MIGIRVLTVDDWPLWRELRLAALTEAPYAFGSRLVDWQGDGDREQRWRDRLALTGSYNLVALLDDQPVGMASGLPGDGVAELISMWVSPRARGRGIGDLLVREVEEWARQRGFRLLRLAVAEGNAAAAALYARNGLRPTGEACDGEYVMAKVLNRE